MDIIIAIIAALVALVAGLVIGLRLGQRGEAGLRDRLVGVEASLAREQGRVLELSGTTQALQARLEEREQTAAQFEAQMRQTIDVLLSRSGEEFVKLADRTAASLSKQTEGALATGEERIKRMVEPLADLVKRYDLAIQEMERQRSEAYGSLEGRLVEMVKAEQGLQSETNKLVTALRRPEVRGHWGEMTLENAARAAGLTPGRDYQTQVTMPGDGGTQRPDMIVTLPGGKKVIVDAKVPLDAYLNLVDCNDPTTRAQCLRDHAAQFRKHLDGLAAKAYWERITDSPDCVVMFVPMESLFAAALEADAELMRHLSQSRVVVATPTTLMAILYAVHYGWQQHTFAENAVRVRDLASQLYDRVRVFAGHFQKVGSSLDTSVDAYNKAVGSLERNLLVSARRLKEMGTTEKEDLPELKPVETMSRELGAELAGALPEGEESEGAG